MRFISSAVWFSVSIHPNMKLRTAFMRFLPLRQSVFSVFSASSPASANACPRTPPPMRTPASTASRMSGSVVSPVEAYFRIAFVSFSAVLTCFPDAPNPLTSPFSPMFTANTSIVSARKLRTANVGDQDVAAEDHQRIAFCNDCGARTSPRPLTALAMSSPLVPFSFT